MSSFTRAQVRALDQQAEQRYGVPGRVLMENAGLLATLEIVALLGERSEPGPVAILCGGGNNGGDGFVIARQLLVRGIPVEVFCTHPAGDDGGDASLNRAAATSLGVPILPLYPEEQLAAARSRWARASLLVDALLGTGFQGDIRPPLAAIIDALNDVHLETGLPVVAIDLPSGLDCDLGVPCSATVRADWTLTFAGTKRGFEVPDSEPFVGQVRVLPIGVPAHADPPGEES